MGSFVELNDTLQITKAQGFPSVLEYEKHRNKPFIADEFADNIFEFSNKKDIRNYQQIPTRCFLVENIDDKWIYWGLVHILEVHHDYVKKTTSGKYKIIYIYPPEDMRKAYDLIDRREDMSFI